MNMDYNEELAVRALNQLNRPDGKPLFEHASLLLRLMYTADVANYVNYTKTRTPEALVKLFPASDPDSLKTLSLSKGTEPPFGGEWFMNVSFGKNVTVAKGTNILAHGGITFGDHAVVSEQAQLVTVSHPVHPGQRHLILIGPLAIGENALVGAGSIVMNAGAADPVVVGKGSIVLPGAIVGKSVPDYSVVGGVNKILLQGKEYFTAENQSAKMSARLTASGLEVLREEAKKQGIAVPEDIGLVPEKNLPKDVRVIDHEITKDLNRLGTFFPGASQDVLRMALFFPPIYVGGKGRIELGNNTLINTSSIINVDGNFTLGDGSFMAPEVELNVPSNSTLLVDKKVWLGAKVKVSVPPGETLSIGSGSVLAAGAEVSSSVPPMSVVVGKGNVTKSLTDNDLYDVPPVLNDFGAYEEQRIKVRTYIAELSREEVERLVQEQTISPNVPQKFNGLWREKINKNKL